MVRSDRHLLGCQRRLPLHRGRRRGRCECRAVFVAAEKNVEKLGGKSSDMKQIDIFSLNYHEMVLSVKNKITTRCIIIRKSATHTVVGKKM